MEHQGSGEERAIGKKSCVHTSVYTHMHAVHVSTQNAGSLGRQPLDLSSEQSPLSGCLDFSQPYVSGPQTGEPGC